MAACTNKPVTAVENDTEDSEVAFEVAKNNFYPAIDRYLTDSIGSHYANGQKDFW